MNMILAIKVRVSLPPISVLTIQTALADKISFVGPCDRPKMLVQKGKSSH